MGKGQEKESLFSKLKNIISGAPKPENKGQRPSDGIYSPKEKDPLDVRFVKHFTQVS